MHKPRTILEKEIQSWQKEIEVFEERIRLGGSIYRDMDDLFIPWDKHMASEDKPRFKTKEDFEKACIEHIQADKKKLEKAQEQLNKRSLQEQIDDASGRLHQPDPMEEIIREDLQLEAERIEKELAGSDVPELDPEVMEKIRKKLHQRTEEYEARR